MSTNQGEAAEADADVDGDEPARASDPARCSEHGLVHPEARPWLPKQESEDLAPHPYCTECGKVMGIGKAGGLDHGDLVNLVSDLEAKLEDAGHVVTEAQKRLIFKRIREDEIDDPFGFTRDTQLALVSEIASTYLGLPEETVASYIERAAE
jgi:hypothetical protein